MDKIKFIAFDKQSKSSHILEAEVPGSFDQVTVFLRELSNNLASSCSDGVVSLALIASAFVAEKGPIFPLVEATADKMELPTDEVAIPFIAAFGAELFKAELKLLKDKCTAAGMDVPTVEWIKEHVKEAQFAATVHHMKELGCDCPACILFWSAKRFEQGMSAKDCVDEFIEVIKMDVERGNEHCVKHLIPDSDKENNWLRGE